MRDEAKTKEQLICELAELRSRIVMLEAGRDTGAQQSESSTSEDGWGEVKRTREHPEEPAAELARANDLLLQQMVERQKAEDALRESESRFRRLAENAPDIIYRYELLPQRRFSYVSPAVKLITGYSPEEYYADPDLSFKMVHPEDRHLLECVFRQDLSMDCSAAVCLPALRWMRKDGSIIWTEEHTAPIHDEAGNLVAIEGVARNITQRKQAEQALRTMHQQLFGIVEFLPDATFVIDAERKVIAWNRAIEEMTGLRKEKILGEGGYAYALPFYGEPRPMLIDLVFSNGEQSAEQYDFVKKKGTTLCAEAYVPMTYQGTGAYLWITATPLCDSHGNLIGAIESIRDISDYKEMQEALRDKAERIKHFAYSVSHDLKSPIIGINGLTRLLHRQYHDCLDERGKKYCEQILLASQQVVSLIEEINVYIRTREIPLAFERIQPKEVLQMVRDEFGALLGIKQVTWSEPEFMPEIRADRLSLLRVFRNLVDNALKYGGEQLHEIRIEYQETDEFHTLSVSDDGVGIKHEDFEKIFGVFQRNETSRGVEGTGLGLAIVREIAERHRGRVTVESENGKGATFYVSIAKQL